MSVVAAVGPGAAAAAASYGHGQPMCGAGGGARKRKDVGVVQDQEADPPVARGSEGRAEPAPRRGAGLFVLETVEEETEADAERSSIGAVSEDEEEEDGEEVDSGGTTSTADRRKGGALASMDMDALDDALPTHASRRRHRSFARMRLLLPPPIHRYSSINRWIVLTTTDTDVMCRRGLSNFFSGKSRSFANLQDAASAVTSARDLAKPENPFNKRRRVLRCCSIRRVASTSLTALPPFFPDGSTGDDGDGAGGRSG